MWYVSIFNKRGELIETLEFESEVLANLFMEFKEIHGYTCIKYKQLKLNI